MNKKQTPGQKMRVIHRYLGFFLAGIMAVYAISGIVLIFRNTDFLKREVQIEKTIEANITAAQLGQKLKIKRLKVDRQVGSIMYFKNGTYNVQTGEAQYTIERLPFFLDKMTKMHKATTNSPLFFLNIFFGLGLLFFVISAFFMYTPTSSVFRKGLYWTIGGIILTLIILFV